MSGSRKTDRAHLEALRKLRQLVASDYKEGGWLSSGREMCAQFNVSRNTYIKALRCLEVDGTAKSYSTRGHYIVPEFLRVKKIGIILQGGEDSPFLNHQAVFGSLLTELKKYNIGAQLIQAADFKSIPDKALIHGVIGALVIFPNANQVSAINQMSNSADLPFWAIEFEPLNEKLEGVTVIQRQYKDVVEARVRWLKHRSHTKVAFVSRDCCNNFGFKALKQRLIGTGIRVYPVSYNNEDLLDLSILSEDRNITAVIVEGAGITAYNILKEFSKFNRQHAVTDLYMHDSVYRSEILECYPDVKVTAIGCDNTEKLAITAVKSLADYFIKGISVKSQEVPIHRIEIMSE